MIIRSDSTGKIFFSAYSALLHIWTNLFEPPDCARPARHDALTLIMRWYKMVLFGTSLPCLLSICASRNPKSFIKRIADWYRPIAAENASFRLFKRRYFFSTPLGSVAFTMIALSRSMHNRHASSACTGSRSARAEISARNLSSSRFIAPEVDATTEGAPHPSLDEDPPSNESRHFCSCATMFCSLKRSPHTPQANRPCRSGRPNSPRSRAEKAAFRSFTRCKNASFAPGTSSSIPLFAARRRSCWAHLKKIEQLLTKTSTRFSNRTREDVDFYAPGLYEEQCEYNVDRSPARHHNEYYNPIKI